MLPDIDDLLDADKEEVLNDPGADIDDEASIHIISDEEEVRDDEEGDEEEEEEEKEQVDEEEEEEEEEEPPRRNRKIADGTAIRVRAQKVIGSSIYTTTADTSTN